ncbi:MAG: hypothetical protein U0P30_08645 [Vicinamibacterales bacterium]
MAILLRIVLLFILATLLVRAVGRFLGGLVQGAAGPAAPPRPSRPVDVPMKMAKDPVCGTFVVPGKALSLASGRDTVWFCSEACREAFGRRN